jgi:hypothetical protein
MRTSPNLATAHTGKVEKFWNRVIFWQYEKNKKKKKTYGLNAGGEFK